MTHDEFRDSLPALALHSLDPAEEIEVNAHIQNCRECAELLESYRETAGQLALAAQPLQPSPGLRARTLSEALRTPQERSQEARPTRKPAFAWRGVAMGLTAAAVVVSAAFSGWMALRLKSQNELIDQQTQALAIASSSSARVAAMSGTSRASTGQVFVSADQRQAAVLLSKLPDPGSNVYTLWLISGGKPSNVHSFRPDQAGVAVIHVSHPVEADSKMAITMEPAPDNPAPTGPIILSS